MNAGTDGKEKKNECNGMILACVRGFGGGWKAEAEDVIFTTSILDWTKLLMGIIHTLRSHIELEFLPFYFIYNFTYKSNLCEWGYKNIRHRSKWMMVKIWKGRIIRPFGRFNFEGMAERSLHGLYAVLNSYF